MLMHHIHPSFQRNIAIHHTTGALPRKQQKVPYPMKLGLMKAKKKREQKALLEQKDSQVVLVAANVSRSNNVSNKNYRRNNRR